MSRCRSFVRCSSDHCHELVPAEQGKCEAHLRPKKKRKRSRKKRNHLGEGGVASLGLTSPEPGSQPNAYEHVPRSIEFFGPEGRE